MILHIINKSPFDNNALDDCLRVASTDCSLLFIENGVYAALGLPDKQQQLIAQKNINVYFLEADIDARGLREKTSADTAIVNDQGFVDLVVQHLGNQSWF